MTADGPAMRAFPAVRDPGGDAATYRLELLGGFRLTVGARPVELPLPAKRLLAVLAMHDKPLRRSYVAGLLWPDVCEERARGNLRSTIWRLGAAQGALDKGSLLGLHPDVWVDVAVVGETARRVIAERDRWSVNALATLTASCDVLTDWHDDWLMFERERFNQLRLLALDCLSELLLRTRRVPEATMAALAAVNTDPLRESSQQLLIECYIAQGNRTAALRQYRAFDAILRRELGVQPPETVSALVSSLVAQVPAGPDVPPPARTGALTIHAWLTDVNGANGQPLRARVSYTVDVVDGERTIRLTSSAEEMCDLVRAWVREMLRPRVW